MVGLTGSTLPSASIDNTLTKYYQAVVTNGVCPSVTITSTVNVNPTSVAGLAAISSGTSTICYGTVPASLPIITLAGNTGTVIWQSSTSIGGTYTNIGGTNSPVIDNSTSKYYRASVKSGVCTPAVSNEIFVSVDQPSVAGNISPSSQNICIGNSPTPISLTGFNGSVQWQSSTMPTGTYTDMVGLTGSTLPSSSIDNTITKYYQAVVTNGVCPSVNSLISVVNISQLPVPGNINLTGNSEICYGTTGSGLPLITLSGSLGSIQWQSSSSISGVYTNIAGTTSPIIDNTATKYYLAKVSNGPCNAAITSPVVINVDPLSLAGSIANPTPRICQASVPADLTLSGFLGTIQWQIATSPSGTYSNLVGLNNAILPSSFINNNTTSTYKAVVTSGVCPSASVSTTVLVDPTSSAGIATLTGTSTICYGTSTASLPIIKLAGNVGVIQWQSSNTISGTYMNIGGTNSPIIDNTTSKYYRASVTSGVCLSDNSNPIFISVDPTSQVGPIAPLQKLQEWCIGSPATNIVLPSNVGTIIWQTANSLTGTYSTINGQTTATLPSANIPTNTAGVLYYRAQVTSGVCPAIYSDIASVQVDAATVAGTISSTLGVICNNSPSPTINLTGNTGSKIVWQYSTNGSTYTNTVPSRNGTSISDVINNSAPGSVQVTTYYKALVQNGVCPSQTTNAVTVSVDPTSQVGPIALPQKLQEWCIGSPATSIVLPSNVGTIIWQTANSLTGTYSAISGQTTATLPSANIPTNTAGVLYYRAQVTSGVCPAIYSDIASIKVDAVSKAGTLSGVSQICNQDAKPTFTILNDRVGDSIVWQVSAPPASIISKGSAASLLSYINAGQSGLLLNNAIDNNAPGINSSFRYYRAVVKNGACPADTSAPKELEVIPTPIIDSIKSNERCGPGIVQLYAHSNLGVVNWFNSITGGVSLYTGETFITPNLTNKFNNYYASGLFRGCASLARKNVVAEVITIPTVPAIPDSTYCGPHVFNICASATDNGIINWYTTPTGGTPIQVGNCYTTPLLKANTTYYLDAAYRGCTTVTRTPLNAVIYEVPKIAEIPTLNLCAGNKLNLIPFTSLGLPPYTFSITYNTKNLLGLANGNINGIKGGITNVYFNIKDQHNCVSQNSNTFMLKTYDPVAPLSFNYEAYYKDDLIIPTKKDSGYILYNWNPGINLNFTNIPDPIFNGENSTDYVLVRTDTTSKCTVADNYHIEVTRDFILEVPNAFTPNYDGINDKLRVLANAGIEYVENFRIFNREGLQVFPTDGSSGWSSKNIQPNYESFRQRSTNVMPNGDRGWDTWDGKDSQGRVLETDGYYWKALIHLKDKTSKVQSGMFLLLK